MLDSLQNFELIPVSVYTLIANLIVAPVCGIFISVVYRLVYRGPSYSVSFTNALVIVSLITAMVIMVIGNNLARTFGLAGRDGYLQI